MTTLDLLRALLQFCLFTVALRYFQDSMLADFDKPQEATAKWKKGLLAAGALAGVDLALIGIVIALGLISPGAGALAALLALLMPRVVTLLIYGVVLKKLFQVPFGKAFQAAAWTVFVAVVGDVLARMSVGLLVGMFKARPWVMLAISAGIAASVGALAWFRRVQHRRLVALSEKELSPEEQAALVPQEQEAIGIDASQKHCASCGEANPLDAEACESCGISFDVDLLQEAARSPIHWRWALIMAGGAALLLLTSLLSWAEPAFLRFAFPTAASIEYTKGFEQAVKPAIVVEGGLFGIASHLLLMWFAAAAVTFVAKRRIYREVVLGSLMVIVFHWCIWMLQAEVASSALTSPVSLTGANGGMLFKMPPFMFQLMLHILGVGAALAGTAVAQQIGRRVAKQEPCYACGELYSVVPRRPQRCPSCSRVVLIKLTNWKMVGAALTATVAAFVLIVALGGNRLNFHWACDATTSEACVPAKAAMAKHRYNSSVTVLRGPSTDSGRPLVIIHVWKYLGLLALVFFAAPLLTTWRAKTSRIRHGGLTLIIGWALCSLAALLFFGYSHFELALMYGVRLHILAALIWGLAGAFGMLIGSRLAARKSSEFDLMV